MADVLIKGLDMPKGEEDLKIIINADGSVERIIGWAICEKKNATAIELPPHGRIVDLDKVLDWLINEKRVFSMAMSAKLVNALSDAPVILEAST